MTNLINSHEELPTQLIDDPKILILVTYNIVNDKFN